MFVKVQYEQITHSAILEFDLYSIGGELLLRGGTPINGKVRRQLRQGAWYRCNDHLPNTEYFNHEGNLIPVPTDELTDAELRELAEEEASRPIYGQDLSQSFVASIQHFWQRMAAGATPDIALCEVVRDKMIAEVTDKAEQIKYLSQVRVRDEFTYSHILDVTALSIALAIKAGFSKREIQEIALAAILHDMGKLQIPRQIMFKPGRLTEQEFQVMKLHPELGYRMIVNELGLPDAVARPALEHQEMYGGGGYPQNLKGDEIHPYSHVVKIADVYDALTSKRPYKESIPSSRALKIMLSEGEKSFHPELLQHFVELSNYKDHSVEPVRRQA